MGSPPAGLLGPTIAQATGRRKRKRLEHTALSDFQGPMLSPPPGVSGADARPPVVKDASPRHLHAPYLLFRTYSVAALTPTPWRAFTRQSYP
jgi:hypothetical protein